MGGEQLFGDKKAVRGDGFYLELLLCALNISGYDYQSKTK